MSADIPTAQVTKAGITVSGGWLKLEFAKAIQLADLTVSHSISSFVVIVNEDVDEGKELRLRGVASGRVNLEQTIAFNVRLTFNQYNLQPYTLQEIRYYAAKK